MTIMMMMLRKNACDLSVELYFVSGFFQVSFGTRMRKLIMSSRIFRSARVINQVSMVSPSLDVDFS